MSVLRPKEVKSPIFSYLVSQENMCYLDLLGFYVCTLCLGRAGEQIVFNFREQLCWVGAPCQE